MYKTEQPAPLVSHILFPNRRSRTMLNNVISQFGFAVSLLAIVGLVGCITAIRVLKEN